MKIDRKMLLIYFILFIYVILILAVSNIALKNEKLSIDIFGKVVKADRSTLIKENNEYYLSYSFVKENIDKDIHFDNVSKKIVVSSSTALVKARVNDKNISNNFLEEELETVAVLEKDDKYISLSLIEKAYDLEYTVFKNTIYIYEKNGFECSLKINRVNVSRYGKNKSRIVDYVYKNQKIVGLREYGNFVLVKINDERVGYILKNMLNYDLTKNTVEKDNTKKSTYLFITNPGKYAPQNLNVDGLVINAFDVNKTSGSISIKEIDKKFVQDAKNKGYKVYGTVTNGYNLTSFNRNITSQILSDEVTRVDMLKKLISNINEYNLDGLAIDFKMLKETDRENYVQFVKEFNALNDKESIIIIDANDYKNYVEAINYSDFCIINMYGLRDLSSNVAGPISEIKWMESILTSVISTSDKNKIVVTLPLYSVLWTEKNSNIINAEIYSLDAIEDYISRNKLEKTYNNKLGQNYVELKKGSLVYKMWIEDETSIKNRVNAIKQSDVRGIAMYKFGYENKKIVDIINKVKDKD